MRAWIKKASIVALTAVTLAGATITTSVPANAQRFGGFHHGWGGGWHGGWHRGWGRGWGWGPAIAGGIAFGALAASPWGCGPVRRVVGFDPWGQPIVRWVNNCW